MLPVPMPITVPSAAAALTRKFVMMTPAPPSMLRTTKFGLPGMCFDMNGAIGRAVWSKPPPAAAPTMKSTLRPL